MMIPLEKVPLRRFQGITIGGLGIWAMVDVILIVVGSFTDADGRRVFQWVEPGSL